MVALRTAKAQPLCHWYPSLMRISFALHTPPQGTGVVLKNHTRRKAHHVAHKEAYEARALSAVIHPECSSKAAGRPSGVVAARRAKCRDVEAVTGVGGKSVRNLFADGPLQRRMTEARSSHNSIQSLPTARSISDFAKYPRCKSSCGVCACRPATDETTLLL